MNVGAIIFDSRQGTTFMPIPTAMGEAYLFGEAVVMDDDSAIKTLQTQAAVRELKAAEPAAEAEPAADTVAVSADSAVAENAVQPAPAKSTAPEFGDEPGKFFYREKVILSEAPSRDGKGSVAAKGPIQGFAKLIASPKMDTQVFSVNADREGFMVVAGNYHPYWKAYVNGAEAKVYKAFGSLRAVEIPAGKSEVRMEFRSAPFHKTILVSLVAAIALAGLAVFSLVRCKKK
jgi:hypothetical protein